jgi:hypothetical protein
MSTTIHLRELGGPSIVVRESVEDVVERLTLALHGYPHPPFVAFTTIYEHRASPTVYVNPWAVSTIEAEET